MAHLDIVIEVHPVALGLIGVVLLVKISIVAAGALVATWVLSKGEMRTSKIFLKLGILLLNRDGKGSEFLMRDRRLENIHCSKHHV
jgi:hypothetical protein